MPFSSAVPVPIAFVFGSSSIMMPFAPPSFPKPEAPSAQLEEKKKKPAGTVNLPRNRSMEYRLKKGYQLLDKGNVSLFGQTYQTSMFRWMYSINQKHKYLVYIPNHFKLQSGKYVWRIVFMDTPDATARYVGGLDSTVGAGRALFELVDTLHDKDFVKKAWWTKDRKRLPPFGPQPSSEELVYFPRPVPQGADPDRFVPFEEGQWVSLLSCSTRDPTDDLGYVYRVLMRTEAEIVRPIYVVVLVKELRVASVYHEYLREPRIDCAVAPELGDCWWNRQSVLHEDLLYFPAPGGGFNRGDIVSVFAEDKDHGVCARVVCTWLTSGIRYYRVAYPLNDGWTGSEKRTYVFTLDCVRGPHTDWNLSSYTWDACRLSLREKNVYCPPVEMFVRAPKKPRREVMPVPDSMLSMPELVLGPPAIVEAGESPAQAAEGSSFEKGEFDDAFNEFKDVMEDAETPFPSPEPDRELRLEDEEGMAFVNGFFADL